MASDDASTGDPQYEELYRLLALNGADGVDSVRIADFGLMGRGLRCAYPIPGGRWFLKVPLAACLTAATARAHQILGPLIQRHWGDAPVLCFYIQYLVSRSRDDIPESEHLSWVHAQTLPKPVQGAYPSNQAAQDAAKEVYDATVATVETAAGLPTGFPGFLWALSVLMSRAMSFNDLLVLVPLADMLNHVPSPTDARYHLLATADQCVYIYARYDFEPGEQVTISYGRDLPDSLLHYGITI
eukprot:TRINITY_DN17182_c0_g1_i1.p1 TRINITY_DN17182_c0_g1~~TRINITY_DN17182_c0_g1_i1.p1  ORF type:complete len:254 (+),score=45.36 TRINITY_DN17182_c0_g1_i1:39-764(+)